MSNQLIEAKGLKRYYHRGSETVKALDGVDFTLAEGEMVSILGPSGSGKTTLINLLSCLDAPSEGSLTVAGKQVAGLSEDELVEVRRGVLGFVFQQFHLLPTLTVTENVELPLTFLGRKPDFARTREVLGRVGLLDRMNHLPHELSGGQMQRVAIARALMIEPKILVADEPTGNLDKATGESIFELFHSLAQQGLAIIITTHNMAFGYEADRVITLEDGKILKEERPKKWFKGKEANPLPLKPSLPFALRKFSPFSWGNLSEFTGPCRIRRDNSERKRNSFKNSARSAMRSTEDSKI